MLDATFYDALQETGGAIFQAMAEKRARSAAVVQPLPKAAIPDPRPVPECHTLAVGWDDCSQAAVHVP